MTLPNTNVRKRMYFIGVSTRHSCEESVQSCGQVMLT
jgi:hypothetical protein